MEKGESEVIDNRFLKINMSDGKTAYERVSDINTIVFNAKKGSLVLRGKERQLTGAYCNVVCFEETEFLYFPKTESAENQYKKL